MNTTNTAELGPDGKEWAKTQAGFRHVEELVARTEKEPRLAAPGVSDKYGPWHGWAVREAFVAGAEWQESRALASAAIPAEPVADVPLKIEVCKGQAGLALYVNDKRVAGPRHNGAMETVLGATIRALADTGGAK